MFTKKSPVPMCTAHWNDTSRGEREREGGEGGREREGGEGGKEGGEGERGGGKGEDINFTYTGLR